METKWIAICVIGFATAMFSPLVVTEYTKGQCKVSFAQSDKTAEDIVKICGK
jgi:hypothetical protein